MMKVFKADLHIHTVLSPCGDLAMSPRNIVNKASEMGLDIIGITDHNSTRHCEVISKLAKEKGIMVLSGAEINTKEEVHCLTFFDGFEKLFEFQQYLDKHLPDIYNDPDYFGYQVVVDENDVILEEIKKLLISALDQSIEEVEAMVHSLGGIFIPAHVDKKANSIYSQLGFFPEGLFVDGIEVSARVNAQAFKSEHPELSKFAFVTNSDAHLPELIGSISTQFLMYHRTFEEIKMALGSMGERRIIL
jgi:3',5'-nucleoside bisphosphate phosphatase